MVLDSTTSPSEGCAAGQDDRGGTGGEDGGAEAMWIDGVKLDVKDKWDADYEEYMNMLGEKRGMETMVAAMKKSLMERTTIAA